MERNIIEEPQLGYLLELFSELGSAANYFILVGARAMRFTISKARPTKDFDFVLDVVTLRGMTPSIAGVLEKLQYDVDPQAHNFQFVKKIPDSPEKIRIEFLASEKEKRLKDFRVDVQKNIHARACIGAEIVLRESDYRHLEGVLPSGRPAKVQVRIARPHSLLMMKLFAMDDKHKTRVTHPFCNYLIINGLQ